MSEALAILGDMNTSTGVLLEHLESLDAALGAIARASLEEGAARMMTDAEVRRLAAVAESLGRRADALRIAAAGEVDDRSRAERGEARMSSMHGCANAGELLTRLTHVSAATARGRIQLARSISTSTALTGETLPATFAATRAAFDAGEIGIDTVTAIVRTLAPIADRCHPTALAAADTELIAAATGTAPDGAPPCAADDTRIQARVWALVLDPDGTPPDHERAMRRRGLSLGVERDGVVPIRGALLPDVAAQLRRLNDAYLNPRVDDPAIPGVSVTDPSARHPAAAASADAQGDDPSAAGRHPDTSTAARSGTGTGPVFVETGDGTTVAPPDARTRAQRQHDVLAAVLGVAARAAATPTIGGAAPTLLVTIAASELEDERGAGFVDGTDTPVPAFIARHIACCGGIQRIVFADDGRIVELGSPQRVFTAHQRRAIVARDGGCVIPGCHVPASWCELHHVTEHARGGPTHTDNGASLCWYHHRTLETSGWAVRIIDGIVEVRAPAWIDPQAAWRPAAGSPHRQHDRLRRRLAGT